MLATAVDDEFIVRNPCRIRGAGSDPKKERTFVPAEVVLALADIAHPRIRPMILVAGFGGLRYGELRGLRVRHYDRLKATVTVREAIDKRTRRKQPKTESSRRTVVLPRFVLDAIDDHLVEFVSGGPDGPLFPGEAGGIISDGWFQREWRLAKRTIGLPDMHFHDLRHTAGTVATQQGATMKEVMSRLGHSTTSAAIRYQKAAADRDQLIADKLDAWALNLQEQRVAEVRPASVAGFSRVFSEPAERAAEPETAEAPAVAGASSEYPQRDSNPCRHLESSTRAVRPVRSGDDTPVLSAFSVRLIRRERPCHAQWITKRITRLGVRRPPSYWS